MLRAHCAKVREDEPLVDLATKLLVWKPEECWSAAQALQHACWDSITQEDEEEANEDKRDEEDAAHVSPPQAKRAHLDNSSSTSDSQYGPTS